MRFDFTVKNVVIAKTQLAHCFTVLAVNYEPCEQIDIGILVTLTSPLLNIVPLTLHQPEPARKLNRILSFAVSGEFNMEKFDNNQKLIMEMIRQWL